MATEQSFVEYVQTQSGLGRELTFKRMFGEYALYLDGKVVAFACDNQLYVKPTDEGRAILKVVHEHPAYPGSKMYFRIDDELEDRDLLRQVLVSTARVLPLPKPKPAAKSKATAKPGAKAKPAARSLAARKAKAKPAAH